MSINDLIKIITESALLKGLVIIVGIGGLFLGLRKYIEDRISDALSKDEIIQKLSLLVKPDMIFDEKNVIVVDRGASALIKDGVINIDCEDICGENLPAKISITFKNHLKTAPLLTPLHSDGVYVKTKRGAGYSWIFELHYDMTTSPDDDPTFTRQYRLEIY